MRAITIILLSLVLASFAERTPEQKSGTIAVLKTLRGEPGGIDPEFLAYKRITRPSTQCSYKTPGEHFWVHYDTSGYHAVDSVGFAIKIGEYLERSWEAYIDTMGYLPPPSDGSAGGDSLYDVYLRSMGYYGLTYPGVDGPAPWEDYSSYIEINKNFDGAYPNDDPEGPVAGAMKVTCAHEFHHAVQFGLRGTNAAWIAEMTSISMEERLYPQVNDYIWLVDYLMSDPHLPINWNAGYHMYGLGLYAQYWNMVHTDDFLYTYWDTLRYIREMDALYTTCSAYGTTLLDDFGTFAAYALLTGSRDCGFFPDGAALSDMTVARTHNSYPANGGPAQRPYGYGINYVIFEGFDTVSCDLNIEFTGDTGLDWSVKAIWKTADTAVFYDLDVGDFGFGEVRVPFANESEFIGLSIVPAGTTMTRYNYSYSAEILPAGIDEAELPDKTIISAYPNPFNSTCKITVDFHSRESGNPLDAIPELPLRIEIYDITGKLVRTLGMGEGAPRSALRTPHSFFWDGTDNSGQPLPTGIYFIKPDGYNSISKITLIE